MSQDQKVLYPDGTRWVMASNVSRSAAVAVAGVTPTEGASTRAHFRNGSPIAVRLARNDPGARFQKRRVNPRGCRGSGAAGGQLRQIRFDFGREEIVTATKNNQIGQRFSQLRQRSIEILHCRKPSARYRFCGTEQRQPRFAETGRASPIAMRIS